MGMIAFHAQQKEVTRSKVVPAAQTATATQYSAHLRSNQEAVLCLPLPHRTSIWAHILFNTLLTRTTLLSREFIASGGVWEETQRQTETRVVRYHRAPSRLKTEGLDKAVV